MFVEYVDTKWYLCIIIATCFFLGISLILSLFETYRISINKRDQDRCIRENWKAKYEKKIEKGKKHRRRFIAFAIIMVYIISTLVMHKNKYAIHEEFAWKVKERSNMIETHFTVVERELLQDILIYETMLHIEWYDNRESEDIDSETLELYDKNVSNIFSVSSEKENRIGDVNGLDSIFMEKKINFEKLVKEEHANLDSEELWKGYEDGVEVCKIYESSENVFQTGVLAESACENAYKSQQSRESCLIYTAGMLNQFEKFLEFRYKEAGGGIEISKVEVSFRIEKRLYQVSRENWNYDNRIAEHCGLFAYSCSQYSIERMESDDDNYLIYLDNSGLNCLNILKFIDDKELCVELCQMELKRWECLDEKDVSAYKTEGKGVEEIFKTKKQLQDYVRFSG